MTGNFSRQQTRANRHLEFSCPTVVFYINVSGLSIGDAPAKLQLKSLVSKPISRHSGVL